MPLVAASAPPVSSIVCSSPVILCLSPVLCRHGARELPAPRGRGSAGLLVIKPASTRAAGETTTVTTTTTERCTTAVFTVTWKIETMETSSGHVGINSYEHAAAAWKQQVQGLKIHIFKIQQIFATLTGLEMASY